MRSTHLGLLTALAAALLVVAGCGGGGGGNKTPAADTTSSSGATEPSGGGSEDVKEVARKFSNSTFTAKYRLSGGDPAGEGKMTLYKDGDKKLRFDVSETQDGKDVTVIFLQSEDVSAF